MSEANRTNWRARMHLRVAESQLDRVIRAADKDLRPRLDASSVAAIILSLAILLTPIAVAALGVFLIFWSGFAVIACVVALCLLAMAWVLLPMVNRLHFPGYDREQLPALFALIDDLSQAMRGPKVDLVVIEPGFNAFIGRYGRRQRCVLGIGLMLWSVLEPRERIALLAHELAHEINDDPARFLLIGMAEDTLHSWIEMLDPSFNDSGVAHSEMERGLAGSAMEFLAWLVWLVLRGLVLLRLRQSQVAEYYADLMAAKMAGYQAEVASQRKLILRPAIASRLVRRLPGQEGAGKKLFLNMRDHMADLPEQTVAALTKRMEEERSSIDQSHPPTAYRLRFLANHVHLAGNFDADSADWPAIDAELELFLEPMGQALLEEPELL